MTQTVGGRVSIKLGNTFYHGVGDLELEESSIEPEAVTNQDGSVGRTVKPKPYRAKISVRHMKGLKIEELMASAGFDATFVEFDTNRRTLLTSAFATGSPSRNTATGEISGFMVEGQYYKAADR